MYAYLGNVVGWQQHSGKGSAPQCPSLQLVSGKYPKQHQQKILPMQSIVCVDFVPAVAGWPESLQ